MAEPATPPGRSRRRSRRPGTLRALPRHVLVASCGVLLAVAVFYLLRKLGY